MTITKLRCAAIAESDRITGRFAAAPLSDTESAFAAVAILLRVSARPSSSSAVVCGVALAGRHPIQPSG